MPIERAKELSFGGIGFVTAKASQYDPPTSYSITSYDSLILPRTPNYFLRVAQRELPRVRTTWEERKARAEQLANNAEFKRIAFELFRSYPFVAYAVESEEQEPRVRLLLRTSLRPRAANGKLHELIRRALEKRLLGSMVGFTIGLSYRAKGEGSD